MCIRDSLWAGGDRGVAVLKSGTFHTLLLAGKQEVRGVTGLAFASDGALWINGGSGILRVSREELSLDDAEPAHTVAFEAFNYLDGCLLYTSCPCDSVRARPLE